MMAREKRAPIHRFDVFLEMKIWFRSRTEPFSAYAYALTVILWNSIYNIIRIARKTIKVCLPALDCRACPYLNRRLVARARNPSSGKSTVLLLGRLWRRYTTYLCIRILEGKQYLQNTYARPSLLPTAHGGDGV